MLIPLLAFQEFVNCSGIAPIRLHCSSRAFDYRKRLNKKVRPAHCDARDKLSEWPVQFLKSVRSAPFGASRRRQQRCHYFFIMATEQKCTYFTLR